MFVFAMLAVAHPPKPSARSQARIDALSATGDTNDTLLMADVVGTFRVVSHDCKSFACADQFEVEAIYIDFAGIPGTRFNVHLSPAGCFSVNPPPLTGSTVFLSAIETEDGALLQPESGMFVQDGLFVRDAKGFALATDIGNGWEPIDGGWPGEPVRWKPPRVTWTVVTKALFARSRALEKKRKVRASIDR